MAKHLTILFLQRVRILAMQTAVIVRAICLSGVCLSVCMSVHLSVHTCVTFRCFVQIYENTIKDTIVRFSVPGMTIILVSVSEEVN